MRQMMNEREKEDQEQLEYLREWQAKHSGRAKNKYGVKKKKYDAFVMDAVKTKQKHPMVNVVVAIIVAKLQKKSV